MRPNSQSFGNFLKSFAFSLIIYSNLLFSVAFLFALGFNVAKRKQQEMAAQYGKQQKQLKPSAVTLAKIP
jgi:hypothetical protein